MVEDNVWRTNRMLWVITLLTMAPGALPAFRWTSPIRSISRGPITLACLVTWSLYLDNNRPPPLWGILAVSAVLLREEVQVSEGGEEPDGGFRRAAQREGGARR